MKSTHEVYGRVTQVFHWGSALLILALFPLGLVMVRMGEGATQTMLYNAHIGIGLLVAVLTIVRVIWRFTEPTPALPAGMSPLRRMAFNGVHILLYLLLLALSLSGVGMLLASGLSPMPGTVNPAAIVHDLPPRAGHDIVSKIYMLLLLAHIAGAALYQFTKGDVMGRMGVRLAARSTANSKSA